MQQTSMRNIPEVLYSNIPEVLYSRQLSKEVEKKEHFVLITKTMILKFKETKSQLT